MLENEKSIDQLMGEAIVRKEKMAILHKVLPDETEEIKGGIREV